MALMLLKDWAIREGIDPSTARQKAGRGSLQTAQKIGRQWFIDESEKNVDRRYKGSKISVGVAKKATLTF